MAKYDRWDGPQDWRGQRLHETLELSPSVVLSRVTWNFNCQWEVGVTRHRSAWPSTKDGVSVGAMTGTGWSEDLGVAVLNAEESLYATEIERIAKIETRTAEREAKRAAIPDLTADDIMKSLKL